METLQSKELKLQKITPNLGVTILDIDPNAAMDHKTAKEIDMLINTHHLVLMKSDKPIEREAQVNLTKQLGEPWRYDYIPGQYKDYPEIFKVTNQKGNGFTNAGQVWHSDGSIYNKRMHLSIFSIDKIPIDGASTYFSNLNYAYERLPDTMKQRLSTLEGNFGKMYRSHPVVWKHPITRIDLLHISEGFKNGFIDGANSNSLSFDESQEIHRFLNNHMWKENTYYEHKWKLGDLVIADNYAVAHLAKPNYSNTLRVLHRTATKGEKRAKRDET
ncbi:TauD/TfdA family dioxygenase [Ulvibacterium sp.]|uniref:TauD/TfdA dioxygenase family protein n=1 Tax=Ulvibacterium sp. TaxID=2665914 RepID=UPI00260646C9|nr:TauD/TfdA family dioxygenase [Ulvibacterium sp.]